MPGKVNPVIAESLLMACAQVVGYDATITWCCAAGNFELNVMMPVMAYDLLESIELLANASRNFDERAIRGLEADRERASSFVEQSLAMCTVLAPEIGYEKAAAIAKEAYKTGRTVREVAREMSGLAEDRLNELLDPRSQTGTAARHKSEHVQYGGTRSGASCARRSAPLHFLKKRSHGRRAPRESLCVCGVRGGRRRL